MNLARALHAQERTQAFDIVELDWADATRRRPVSVRLSWPTRDASSALVPLVVFSHGIDGSRRGYRYLGQHWATHGIASLRLQHGGSDRNLWFSNPLGLIGRLQDADGLA